MDSKDSDAVQIIDLQGNFLDDISDSLNKWNLTEKGNDYHIVAILGAQSSGKSTLLNELFGTNFDVMNARSGRYQTTRGVWLSCCELDESLLLVMDVEGTDSRERGENHGTFERQTSLLSLALADVLIINMWMTDIGRHEGANYTLLRVIFEMNLQLFQVSPHQKSKLVFIFRDCVQSETGTPLESLKNMVREDLENIWNEITKTDASSNWAVTDIFNLDFLSLPSLPYEKENFKNQVSELRARFTSSTVPGSLLSEKRQKNVPIDGLVQYMQEIWKIIQSNQDLNLPSQREMLATVRCTQISQQAFEEFECKLHDWSSISRQVTREECVRNLYELVKDSLQTYDKDAQRYDEKVSHNLRMKLLKQMQLEVSEEWNQYITWTIDLLVNRVNTELSSLEADLDNLDAFYPKVAECYKKNLKDAVNCVNQGRVPEFEPLGEWGKEPLKTEISAKLYGLCVQRCAQIFDSCVKQIHSSLFSTLSSWLSCDLVSFEYDGTLDSSVDTQSAVSESWDHIREFFESSWKQSDALLDRRASQLKLSSDRLPDEFRDVATKALFILGEKTYRDTMELIQQRHEQFRRDSVESLFKCVRSKAEVINWSMEKRFARHFTLDQQGVPRYFYGNSLKKCYQVGCKHAQFALDVVSVFRFEPKFVSYSYFMPGQHALRIKNDFQAVPDDLAVLSRDLVVQSCERFLTYAQNAYMHASAEQERSQRKNYTLVVVIVMFLIFGWNETSYVLARPWLLLLVLLGGSAGLFIYYFRLTPLILPAGMHVLRSALRVEEAHQVDEKPDAAMGRVRSSVPNKKLD
ncbi:protein SEY1 homolog [Schistocerca gregaria]|uniref:protein SEY1 homolog n=1 Tax=Schistocerca gregaria TaxID=7010 RepID=UPI00211DF8B6|nr:protein SEY1 homolog [Schistocerca gregaria]